MIASINQRNLARNQGVERRMSPTVIAMVKRGVGEEGVPVVVVRHMGREKRRSPRNTKKRTRNENEGKTRNPDTPSLLRGQNPESTEDLDLPVDDNIY